jgi:hypothetical protein
MCFAAEVMASIKGHLCSKAGLDSLAPARQLGAAAVCQDDISERKEPRGIERDTQPGACQKIPLSLWAEGPIYNTVGRGSQK